MKIKLKYEKYRKDIIDLYRIFRHDEILFTDDADIIVDKDYIKLDKKIEFTEKIQLKQILYKYFSQKYQASSPWGLITGTKPQKLLSIHNRQVLKDNFFIDEKKIELMESIKEIQDRHTFNKEYINLYINVPFCPSRCSYCSFPTIIYTKKDRRNEYLLALIKEIESVSAYLNERKIRTIYIGGGTPTAFSSDQLEALLSSITKSFDLSNLEEFTVEAGREDTIDYKKLTILKKFGVSRISINPQTFNDKTNSLIERRQDLDRLVNLFKMAYDMGFIINMDLILGLKGETINDVEESLKRISMLKPHNLTVHTLSLKKGSKMVDSGLSVEEERSYIAKMVDKSIELARAMEYKPYYLYRQKEILGNFENIGYTLSGNECIYNIIINEEYESILGLGMTANSKIFSADKLFKFTNYKNLDQYIDQLDYQINNKIKLLKGR